MNNLLTAIIECLTSINNTISAKYNNATDLQVVEDNKDYKKACNIAEKILVITDKYKPKMGLKDKFLYGKLKKQFNKYD